MKKISTWQVKGMNKDMSVSKFSPEFAFENMNLRLSTNEGNTLMSWVNEKGTSPITDSSNNHIQLSGIPIGTAVMNEWLVVFTTTNTDVTYDEVNKKDYIYRLKYIAGGNMQNVILFQGNLNFSTLNPIETLVSYESDTIQKVYWLDGRNQPRMINIVSDKLSTTTYTNPGTGVFTMFDFVPAVGLGGTFKVERSTSDSGIFSQGVIQYCYTYVNKHGQESNIVDVSPLYYIAFDDRGASPEDMVNCGFDIEIEDADSRFDYVKIYSIQRTSIDSDPIVKMLELVPIINGTVSFIDRGNSGSSVDPLELLYIGGKEITAYTMVDKDQTLFIGNFAEKNTSVKAIQDYYDSIRSAGWNTGTLNSPTIGFEYGKYQDILINSGFYIYDNPLSESSNEDLTTFKGGETYRLGFQLQKTTGEWSEPIFLKDVLNDKYPKDGTNPQGHGAYMLSVAQSENWFNSTVIDTSVYKKARPVIVYPDIVDRTVLCQGVLNPTVFNIVDRADNSPYAQPSWYFRPISTLEDTPGQNQEGTTVRFKHYDYLYTPEDIDTDFPPSSTPEDWDTKNLRRKRAARLLEVQNAHKVYKYVFKPKVDNPTSNSQFFVDQSIVTLNSPEIEFDTQVQKCSFENLHLRIVGAIPMAAGVSWHKITTSSAMLEAGHNRTDIYPDIWHVVFPDILAGMKLDAFGKGELSANTYRTTSGGSSTDYGRRLVADSLWEDAYVEQEPDEDDKIETSWRLHSYTIHPWQRSGSLNNDIRDASEASSLLKTKVESNLLFSKDTIYLSTVANCHNEEYENINAQIHLQENEQIYNMRLPEQAEYREAINYYPNIDKVLYNTDGYDIYHYKTKSYMVDSVPSEYREEEIDHEEDKNVKAFSPVSMKYKSGSHAVISLKKEDDEPYPAILPYIKWKGGEYVPPTLDTGDTYKPFWEKANNLYNFTQREITLSSSFSSYLFLGELYRDVTTPFGGEGEEALRANKWVIAGEAIDITGDSPILKWTIGDTYYQRYDCLKTYPFTREDPNQIVEILSFKCETHINLDGRYDKNRGQQDNTNMSPVNFNLLNPIYSQKNNFFPVKKVGNTLDSFNYPNMVTYSKTKTPGAEVDLWTNVTLGSTLELDGDKGSLTSLKRINGNIIAFQDSGISQILYNENAAISTTAGVPIELANSGKVEGKRYISDTVGCSNKWSIVSTPSGIYFIDSYEKSIYLFNGQLANISVAGGMNSWSKQNIPNPDKAWTPNLFGNFKAVYDRMNQDIMLINSTKALAWSEKLSSFTSFYDYAGIPYFENFDDTGIWIDADGKLWKHNAGTYCNFFGTQKPYWMTLIGNPEPTADKIFTNLEMASNIAGEGTESSGKLTSFLPFSHLETWNEYQHGIATLNNLTGSAAMKHFNGLASSLKRKFRLWRCDIPRDNAAVDSSVAAPFSTDSTLGIKRFRAHSIDRMRNPWLYLKLYQEPSNSARKTEIHDVIMTYFD